MIPDDLLPDDSVAASAARGRVGRAHPPLGYACVLGAAALFAVNGSVSKVILQGGITAARLTQLRTTAAFLLLLVIVATTRPAALKVQRSELPVLLAYGVVGVTLTQFLYFVAIARIPVGVALLLEFTAPVFVALWARFGARQAVGRGLWPALALALVGLALVGRVWEGLVFDALGVLAGAGAAGALAIYFLVGEHGVRGRDPLSLTMWGFGASTVLWAVVQPWWTFPWNELAGDADFGFLGRVPLTSLIAYMVLFGTVAAFALNLTGLRHLTATQVGVLGMGEPVLASVVAWVLLGESLTVVQSIGGLVVLAGVFLAERSR